MKTFVFSRTLQQSDHPKVTIINENWQEMLTALRKQPGKDIWLLSGGELLRSLAEAKLVDTVDVGIVPVPLGEGILLLPPPTKRSKLKLIGHKVYKMGIVSLEYSVQ